MGLFKIQLRYFLNIYPRFSAELRFRAVAYLRPEKSVLPRAAVLIPQYDAQVSFYYFAEIK